MRGDGSEEALTRALAVVASAMKPYLAAYMLMVIAFLLLLDGLVVLRLSSHALLAALALAASVAAGVACFGSGRRYVERVFGGYRHRLADLLVELEASAQRG